jgi:protein phosphatase
MLDLEFAELSDRGHRRELNEDCLGHVVPASAAQVQSQGWFFALADGLGGQERGEVASRIAIETVLEGFRKIPKGVMHVSLLPRLIQQANVAVFEHGSDRTRMGTTMVACALRFDSAVVSHVGDSRCYLFRSGSLTPLTRDHTMAGQQVRLGILSQAEADVGETRHILTRCLGNEMFVAADTVTVNIMPGDMLIRVSSRY